MERFQKLAFIAGMLSLLSSMPAQAGIMVNGIASNGIFVNGANQSGLVKKDSKEVAGIPLDQVKITLPK